MRQNLDLYGLPEEEQYVDILTNELGAVKHLNQADAYVLKSVPFYAPRLADDHVSILSFNNMPLPDPLVEALMAHGELFPDDILVHWIQEQDLILEATLGQLKAHIAQH